MFSWNLLHAPLAEWPESVRCYSGNTYVDKTSQTDQQLRWRTELIDHLTLQASLSGTFLSEEDVVNQCLEFAINVFATSLECQSSDAVRKSRRPSSAPRPELSSRFLAVCVCKVILDLNLERHCTKTFTWQPGESTHKLSYSSQFVRVTSISLSFITRSEGTAFVKVRQEHYKEHDTYKVCVHISKGLQTDVLT